MSDSSRFLAYVQFFFGVIGQTGQTPELRQGLWSELNAFSTSGSPHAREVASALMALLDKLDSEWDMDPGRAGMALYRALLDVFFAYSEQPNTLPSVVERIAQQTKTLVI